MNSGDYFFYEDDEIFLRPLERADLAGRWPYWFNSPDVTRFTSMGYYPNNLDEQAKYFEKLLGSRTDVVLAIVDKASGEHIGNIGLHRIDPIHRTAYLGIVIGEPKAWRRGIGAKSWRVITDYGFRILNLHKVCATVVDGNEASLKCALGAGYAIEGRQCQQIFKNGQYRDLITVGVLRTDWEKQQGEP